MLLQFFWDGIVMGTWLALFALGFSLVYNTTRIFHIAYAALFVIAPLTFRYFYSQLSFPAIFAFVISVGFASIVGLFIEIFVYRPFISRSSTQNLLLVSSIGSMIILINIMALFFGSDHVLVVNSVPVAVELPGDIIATDLQVIQFLLSLFIIVMLLFALKYSNIGIIARGMRDSVILTQTLGINYFRFRTLIFILSSAIAGTTGIFYSLTAGVDPYSGISVFLTGMVAVIIGGARKFTTTLPGGLLIGLLYTFSSLFIASRWQDLITFSVLILFLLVRPQGILGETLRES